LSVCLNDQATAAPAMALQQNAPWPRAYAYQQETRSFEPPWPWRYNRIRHGHGHGHAPPNSSSSRNGHLTVRSDPASAMAFHQNTPWPRARSKATVGESQESIPRPSPFGSANMPALGVDARVRPSTAKKERKTPPGQSSKIEVSPFLAYENLRHDAATSPDTWPRSPW
jgi:hypothetical protein